MGKWGKVSLRGRAQVTSREPLLSLHRSSRFALFGLFHRSETLGLLWTEIYTRERLESGHSFSERLPPLPHVTFHCLLEFLIAQRNSQRSHRRWMFKHDRVCTSFFFFLSLVEDAEDANAYTWNLLKSLLLKMSPIYTACIKFSTDISAIKGGRIDLKTKLGY